MALSISNVDLTERVYHLRNKIYRGILCITRDERMAYITIDGLGNQVSTLSWTPQYRIALSWDLLAWLSNSRIDGIPFTDFITTPELSGPFISSRIFIILKLQNIHWKQFFNTNTLGELFFLSSNIFLIAVLLVPPPFIFTIAAMSVWAGPSGITFPMLFRLK